MWVLRLFVFENIEIFRLWTESSVTCANDSLFGNAGRPTSKSEMKIEETKKSVIFLYRNLCDCAWQTQKKSHTEILISYRKKTKVQNFPRRSQTDQDKSIHNRHLGCIGAQRNYIRERYEKQRIGDLHTKQHSSVLRVCFPSLSLVPGSQIRKWGSEIVRV